MTPRTRYIDTPGGKIIIGEHETSCYLCVDNGRGGTSAFLDLEALDALLEEGWVIRRRLRARGFEGE